VSLLAEYCNTYQAGYEVDGNNITIGLPISTLMACAEPDGIMEQEQEYLTALSTAATYQISGDSMEMRTADMSRVASFQIVK
jgi:heat shock protein HslJ